MANNKPELEALSSFVQDAVGGLYTAMDTVPLPNPAIAAMRGLLGQHGITETTPQATNNLAQAPAPGVGRHT